MSFTSDQLAALEAAYASGATSVKHGDKQVNYNSSAALLKAINKLKAQLASPKRRTAGFIAPSDGY